MPEGSGFAKATSSHDAESDDDGENEELLHTGDPNQA
jgi:hypothetical protein